MLIYHSHCIPFETDTDDADADADADAISFPFSHLLQHLFFVRFPIDPQTIHITIVNNNKHHMQQI